jgi:Na+-transporting NADH:ubiquinone oxidoreductase subunit NqrB
MPFGLDRSLDPRYGPLILVTLILVVADLSFGILRGWEGLAVALGVCLLTELVCVRLYWGKWANLASAYMSGISVAILIRSPELWPFALAGGLTILSKYVLRVQGRHIWNPSNFGICAVFFLAPFAVAPLNTQWSNAFWPMIGIWALGLYSVWKVDRLHITVTYIVAFAVLSAVRTFVTGDPFWAEVAPLTGPMYQLFALFMITDPSTTVSSRRGRVIVTILIAIAELFLRLGEVVYAPFYALFLVGPAALLVEMWWTADEESSDAAEAADASPDPERTLVTEGAS